MDNSQRGLTNSPSIYVEIPETKALVPSKDKDAEVKVAKLKAHEWMSCWMVTFTIALILGGIVCGVVFAHFVYRSTRDQQLQSYMSESKLITEGVVLSIRDYMTAVSVLQTYMNANPTNHTREGFRRHAENLLQSVQVQAYQYVPRVMNADRMELETSSSVYWNNRLGTNKTYYVTDSVNGKLGPAANATDYFVIKYIEPTQENEAAINLNILSLSPFRRTGVYGSIDTGLPIVFGPLRIVQEVDPYAWSFIVQYPLDFEEAIVLAAVRAPTMVRRVLTGLQENLELHMFVNGQSIGGFAGNPLATIPSIEVSEVEQRTYHSSQDFFLMEKNWKVMVCTKAGIKVVSDESWTLVVVPALVFLLFFVFLTCWFLHSQRNAVTNARIRAHENIVKAEREGRLVADAERHMNDYLAHEVRNPLSVAMAATHFSQVAVQHAEWREPETLEATEQDLRLVQTSLEFISDLMNNLLDANKFVSGVVEFKETPISIVDDVLIPVQTMLAQKSSNVEFSVRTEPKGDKLLAIGDALRLKQVVVNLAKNSVKFVERGFIRLTAKRDEQGLMVIGVEDSGPGIPANNRSEIFKKYQQTIDNLRQGTGIGLSLCKTIVDAMKGEIYLVDSYRSGYENCPGTRFEMKLPLQMVRLEDHQTSGELTPRTVSLTKGDSGENFACLDHINFLVIDDDAVVRSILSRILKNAFENSTVHEAGSGESGVEFCRQARNTPDAINVIFVDQYMPGPHSNVLNGEATIAELRALGSRAVIIGLSANDVCNRHLKAGADGFVQKPIVSIDTIADLVVEKLQTPYLKKVLVADDEQVNKTMLRRILSIVCPGQQLDFVEVDNGPDALRMATTQDFDLVVLDEHMGSAPLGSQVARQIRDSKKCTAKLVSLSGNLNPENRQVFDMCWSKPLPTKQILAKELLNAFPRK